jgi:hypothetical protein
MEDLWEWEIRNVEPLTLKNKMEVVIVMAGARKLLAGNLQPLHHFFAAIKHKPVISFLHILSVS